MRKEKRMLLVAAMAVIAMSEVTDAFAQKKGEVTISPYGFFDVRSFYDTRKSSAPADGYLYLYPVPEVKTAEGADMSKTPQASMFGSDFRIGVNATGPKVLGADTRANYECDIFNYSSEGHFLFRHCYIGFDWEKSTVLLGQTWHPLGKTLPGVGSIALGSPFNALNRSGQLRLERKAGDGLMFTGAAVFQALSNSVGPGGKSYKFQRKSMIPEICVGIDWTGDNLSLAAGASWLRISPADSIVGNRIKNQYVDGFTGMVQAQYKSGKFSATAKSYLGQNMSHLGFCTGFGKVKGKDDEWAPLLSSVSWLFVDYGGAFKVGCYGGFMKNLGADKELTDICTTGGSIDRMFRIAPNLKYRSGNTTFCLENELTGVSYGTANPKGTVNGGSFVVNNRVLISATYFFTL